MYVKACLVGLLALGLTLLMGSTPAPGPDTKGSKGEKPVAETACVELTRPQLAERLPFGPGEALSYEVMLNGATAAQIDIKLQDKAVENGKRVYPAVVNAKANALVSIWAQMRSELVTLIDPDRTLPVVMRSHTHAEQYKYEEQITFDQAAHRLQASTVYRGKPWNAQLSSDTDVLDALSLVYYARSRQFDVGQPYCMDLYQGRVLWRIRGRVMGKETVQTDAGPMDAFVASGVAGIVGRSGPKAQIKQYTAYMTADEDRVPLLLKAPTPWGDVTVKLVRFEQGRRLARPGAAGKP